VAGDVKIPFRMGQFPHTGETRVGRKRARHPRRTGDLPAFTSTSKTSAAAWRSADTSPLRPSSTRGRKT